MFEIYKKGQGTTARWIAGIGLGALAAFGAYELEEYVNTFTPPPVPLGIATVSLSLLLSVLAFIAAAVLIAWVINLPRFVDYLIMSEVELRKVSWPTRDELKRQTAVVIFTLVAISAILLVADLLFGQASRLLYKL